MYIVFSPFKKLNIYNSSCLADFTFSLDASSAPSVLSAASAAVPFTFSVALSAVSRVESLALLAVSEALDEASDAASEAVSFPAFALLPAVFAASAAESLVPSTVSPALLIYKHSYPRSVLRKSIKTKIRGQSK